MPKDKDAKAIELIGSPEKLINQIIKDKENRDWALHAITLEGPPHKQIQHTLVLRRLEKLLALNKKNSERVLKFVRGKSITLESAEEEIELPISIPEKSLQELADADKVVKKLSKGPQHEVLYTALLLQVIEALIEAQNNEA